MAFVQASAILDGKRVYLFSDPGSYELVWRYEDRTPLRVEQAFSVETAVANLKSYAGDRPLESISTAGFDPDSSRSEELLKVFAGACFWILLIWAGFKYGILQWGPSSSATTGYSCEDIKQGRASFDSVDQLKAALQGCAGR